MYFFNGDFIQEDTIALPIRDRGLMLGDGLFETIYVNQQGVAPQLAWHLQRMTQSLQLLKIDFSLDDYDVAAILARLIAANAPGERAYLRLMVTRGRSERGIAMPAVQKPNFIVTAGKNRAVSTPMSLGFARDIRKDQQSLLANSKTTGYLPNVLARDEAVERGFDDAILLNIQGHIAEMTTANVFFIKDNTLYTPALSDGALPGITRKITLELCQQQNIAVLQQSLPQAFHQQADACFVTNSMFLARAVYLLEDMQYDSEHPLFLSLQQALQETFND